MSNVLSSLDRISAKIAAAATLTTKIKGSVNFLASRVNQYILPSITSMRLVASHEMLVQRYFAKESIKSSVLITFGRQHPLFARLVSFPDFGSGIAELQLEAMEADPLRRTPGPGFVILLSGKVLGKQRLELRIPVIATTYAGNVAISLFGAPTARGTPALDDIGFTRRTSNEAARRLRNFKRPIKHPVELASTTLSAHGFLVLQDGTLCMVLRAPSGGRQIALSSASSHEALQIDLATDLLTSILIKAAAKAGFAPRSCSLNPINQRIVCSFREELGSKEFSALGVGFTARAYGRARTDLWLEVSPSNLLVRGAGTLYGLDFEIESDFSVGPVKVSVPQGIVDFLVGIGKKFVDEMPTAYNSEPICFKIPVSGLKLTKVQIATQSISLNAELPDNARDLDAVQTGAVVSC